MSCVSRALDSCIPALGRITRRICPWISRFLNSSQEEYKALKALFGFPFGFLLGVALYYAVIERMKLPEFLQYGLAALFILALSVGYAKSIQVRCISLLVVPSFFGKGGRGYVAGFALVYLITGPISNIMFNAREVTRSISCSAEIAANQTAAKWELRMKPIHDIMVDLQLQGKRINNITRGIRREFQPIRHEVEDDSEVAGMQEDTDYVDSLANTEKRTGSIEQRHKVSSKDPVSEKKEKKYEQKLDYRCEDVFSAGVIHCRKTFRNAEKRCMDKLWVAGYLLCLPLKLTHLCELVRFLPGLTGVNCDSMEAVNEGFGESFQTAEQAADAMDKNFDVNLQYKVVTVNEDIDVRTAQDVTKEVAYEFELRQRWFDFLMTMIQRFMSFLFIRVFIGASQYHKKYLSNFNFDNIYMTSYFRRIDARRRVQGKLTLLPLKKAEAKEIIEPVKLKLMGPEKSKLIKGTIRVVLNVATVALVFFVDHVIYEVLDIIQEHSRVDYRQRGTHHIGIVVYGKGAIGHLIKTLLKGFNKKHTIENYTSNAKCLPQPRKLDTSYMWKITIVYVITWCLMATEAYGLRLRRVVASFFYPKREKKRILFLYNDMLKKRRGFLRHTRHEVKRKARERRLSLRTDLLMAWRRQFPRLCCCLGYLGLGKTHCLICNEPQKKNFHHCETKGCNFAYCQQCWTDVKNQCYACMDTDELEDSDSDVTNMDMWD